MIQWIEPGRLRVQFNVALARLCFVQNGVPYACEQICFDVNNLLEAPVLDQFQKDLMNSILGPAMFARNGRSKEHEGRAMLGIQTLDLVDVGAKNVHVPE
ncbi:MAG TPA: hypothetical protein VD837_11410 [Terriglobales bacterium]|nr:hypothetical protein [Terriglobales bacterium]